MKPDYTFYVFVRSVLDGDTFRADIDQGFGMLNRGRKGKGVPIRLYGIDCPDKRYGYTQEQVDAATEYTTEWLEGLDSVPEDDRELIIKCHKWDGFGRAISTVWRTGDKIPLSTALYTEGHAVLYKDRKGRKSSK